MKKRGRPKGGAQIGRDSILAAAFDLLDEFGHRGLSMRALAKRLNVTPMALYGHFSNRDALIRGMSDAIYARVVEGFESTEGKPRRRLENLLGLYYEAVVRFPRLTVLIFASPAGFSEEVRRINRHLSDLLAESNLKTHRRKIWRDTLIDLTHGSALATASAPRPDEDFVKSQRHAYGRQLGELLSRIF